MSKEQNIISLDTAKAWTQEWRQDESDYNKYNNCNGFLIPAVDLEEVLMEIRKQLKDKNVYVRAYLGVEVSDTVPAKFTEKLIIVGTRPDPQDDGTIIYRDILPDEDSEVSALGDESSEGRIWNFTEPCPSACDPSSILN